MVEWCIEWMVKTMSRKKRQYMLENYDTYWMYYNRLRDYALSMFKWNGLPDSVNERFLNVKMYEEGKILFFEDKNLGYLTLPFAYGQLNVYGEPRFFQAVSFNYSKAMTEKDCVPIWNNFARQPLHPIIDEYAKRLYHAERTSDVNIHAQKTPILILADESQRLTMINAYEQYEGNKPFIFGNKNGFDPNSISAIETTAPFVADKLQDYKRDIWNEAMNFLGIGNARQDKKERMITDEVKANDEQIEMSRNFMLQARQLACEQINDKFGLNISVEFNIPKAETENEDEEVIDDE